MIWEEIVKTAKILIVDDEPSNVRLMERMLGQAGYRQVLGTTDPRQVVDLYQTFEPDLILLDMIMPDLDGYEVMEQLQPHIPPKSYLPILVLTADLRNETRLGALLLGAKDFLSKPVDRVEAMFRVRILLETRFLFRELAQGTAPLGGGE